SQSEDLKTMNSELAFLDPSCSVPVALTSQRLTALEYNNVVRDLFSLSGDFSSNFSKPSSGSAGFRTESSVQNISAEIVLDFYNGSMSVVEALFALNPNPLLGQCTSGNACAKNILGDLAFRAFRRPLTEDELIKIFSLYESEFQVNNSFEDGLKVAVQGILMSPQFIFRTFDNSTVVSDSTRLTDYELASRLSFFIWGSIPDRELMELAASQKLSSPEVLNEQARRMLKDPKSSYLASEFGYQWAGLKQFESTELDVDRFPEWSEETKRSMKQETLKFLNYVLRNDLSVMEIVSANYTFVDSRVAQIYGISGVSKTDFEKVDLGEDRLGLLSQPAILAMNSLGNHTSPVRRGKWILQNILCDAPPPPPENVLPLPVPDVGELYGESQIRKRMEQHRAQGSTCYSCHNTMDPIGLTFENFDSMGYFRTKYVDGKSVDASGSLPTGEYFQNSAEMTNFLIKDKRFPTCFTAKLASFAQGRDMTSYADKCGVSSMALHSAGKDRKFSDLVVDIVTSYNFGWRKVSGD
ncbi:MAG: DUF1592 domain-containing protein, partial [Bdellovibrionales bacterium]|nr:DUF1592 domain-containing protein [Bdellovibrionales bacterium]